MPIKFLNDVAVDSSVLYVDTINDRVGIGTTDPITRAHIYGPNHTGAFNTGALMIQQSSNDSRMFIDGNDIDTADGILFLNDYSLNPVRLGNDLQVPNGNVGIGNTSPSQKLHVSGNARVTGAYYDSSNSPGTSNQVLVSTVTGTNWIDSTALPGLVDGTGTANYVARWIGTESIGTGVIYDNGTNVGINATSLYSRLHIGNSSNGNSNLLTMESSGPVWVHLKTPSNNQSQIGFGDTQFASQNTRGRIVYNSSSTSANNYMSFTTNFAEVMRITNSNVGIGTTSPAVKLHVGSTSISSATNEEFRLQSGTSSGNGGTAIANLVTGNFGTSGIYFGNNTTYSSQPAHLQYRRSDNTTSLKYDVKFNIDQDGSGTRFNINSSGNVGIGTTSPSAKTHIFNSSVQNGFIVENSSSSFVDSAIYANNTSTTNGNLLRLRSSGSDKMVVLGNGNVGIGTSSPGKLLELKGGDNEAAIRLFNDQANTWDIQNSTLGKLDFIRGGTNTYMRIDQSGNVGIGTTSPAAKLDVDGGVRIADDASIASATNVGTLRYRTSGNNSYVDMCMQTGASTYAWVNIVQNTW